MAESYDLGFKLTTADERFSLRLWGALQLRYTYLDYDERVEGNETDYSNFYMRRARVWFAGNAFDKRFTYYLHIQLEPSNGVNLHDAWLEYNFGDLLILGAGRNKIPYGVEFINSGFGLQFVERSVFSGETDIDSTKGPVYPGGGTERFGLNAAAPTGFTTGGMTLYRSQGVSLRGMKGGKDSSTFEYQLGVWQGRGTTGQSNVDDRHLFAARAGYHPWGLVDSRFQADLEERAALEDRRHRIGLRQLQRHRPRLRRAGLRPRGPQPLPRPLDRRRVGRRELRLRRVFERL